MTHQVSDYVYFVDICFRVVPMQEAGLPWALGRGYAFEVHSRNIAICLLSSPDSMSGNLNFTQVVADLMGHTAVVYRTDQCP